MDLLNVQEENYITCILGDEQQVVAPPPESSTSAAEPQNLEGGESSSRMEKLHFCELCNYSSTYKGNVVRHHRLVHLHGKPDLESPVGSPEGDECVKVEPVTVKEEVVTRSDREEEYVEVEEPTSVIKAEPVAADADEAPSDAEVPESEAQDMTLGANNNKKTGPKYCKSCDISFNYLSTFIAHKKFYCSSHSGENASGRTAEASVL